MRKKPKIAPYAWDIVTLLEEDRATAIGNMHKKFGEDHACGLGDMLTDRQTDRQTDVLITVLCQHSHGRSNKIDQYNFNMKINTKDHMYFMSMVPQS